METTTEVDQGERAYRAIRDDIIRGRIRPGERLVEADIAQRAGVSRTPVRQALQRLEREGVVEIEKRRSARLRALTPRQISDLYELRAQIEGFACRLAARRSSEADHAELRRISAEFDAATRAPHDEGFTRVRRANAALHHRIAAAGDNPFLGLVLDPTLENPLVLRAYQDFGAEALERSALFHRLIVEAICSGEGERASRLMIEHVLQARDTLVAAVGRMQGAASPRP